MLSTLRPRASSVIRASQNDLGRRIRTTLHVASRPDYPSILGQLRRYDGLPACRYVGFTQRLLKTNVSTEVGVQVVHVVGKRLIVQVRRSGDAVNVVVSPFGPVELGRRGQARQRGRSAGADRVCQQVRVRRKSILRLWPGSDHIFAPRVAIEVEHEVAPFPPTVLMSTVPCGVTPELGHLGRSRQSNIVGPRHLSAFSETTVVANQRSCHGVKRWGTADISTNKQRGGKLGDKHPRLHRLRILG